MNSILRFVALLAVALVAQPAIGQPPASRYPDRPIDLIVPVAPAGSLDILARVLAAELEPRLGASVLVKNKPGAGSNIAFEYVAQAAPDGYTLLISPDTISINTSLYPKLNYDPQKSFEPISQVTIAPLVLVTHPGLGVRTVPEFIGLARRSKSRLNVASPGNGSAGHLAGELFQRDTGIAWTHIPYKGGGPAITDLLGHHIDALFLTLAPAVPYIKASSLVGLAVTAARRSPTLPDLPTVAEAGGSPGAAGLKDYEVTNWQGIFAPSGTPSAAVHRINAEIAQIVRDPRIRAKLFELGFEPVGGTPEELRDRLRENIPKWAAIVKQAGIVPD